MQTKQSNLFDLPSSFLWRRAKYQVLLYALEWCFGVKSDHTKKRSPQQHVWHDSQTGLFSRMITLKRSWAGMYAQFEACVFLITCIFCGCCNNQYSLSRNSRCVCAIIRWTGKQTASASAHIRNTAPCCAWYVLWPPSLSHLSYLDRHIILIGKRMHF